MDATTKSELFALAIGITVLGAFGFWRFLVWIRDSPIKPDPWDDATEAAVRQADAQPVCHHCLTPAPPGQWFCECCGSAVGPYNNLMPFLYVFSEGEVLRNGVLDRVPRNPLTVLGYGLYSFCAFSIFAPVYWFFLFRHWRDVSRRDPKGQTTLPD